jgi:hypothetical protein
MEIEQSTDDVVGNFYQHVIATALSIHSKDSLNDEEKFALCVAAGVPVDSRFDGEAGKLRFTTRYPCAVEKIDGSWQVYVNMARGPLTPVSRKAGRRNR